jgi:hypothetical protein
MDALSDPGDQSMPEIGRRRFRGKKVMAGAMTFIIR